MNDDQVFFPPSLFYLQLVPVRAKGNGQVLRRHKREWIVPSRDLKEGHDYTGLDYIAIVCT